MIAKTLCLQMSLYLRETCRTLNFKVIFFFIIVLFTVVQEYFPDLLTCSTSDVSHNCSFGTLSFLPRRNGVWLHVHGTESQGCRGPRLLAPLLWAVSFLMVPCRVTAPLTKAAPLWAAVYSWDGQIHKSSRSWRDIDRHRRKMSLLLYFVIRSIRLSLKCFASYVLW